MALEAIEGSFARNEVSFAIVARQDSSFLKCLSRDSSDSEWIQMCYMICHIREKVRCASRAWVLQSSLGYQMGEVGSGHHCVDWMAKLLKVAYDGQTSRL